MSEMVERLATVFADELDRLQAEDQIEIRATADFSSEQIARRLLEAMREPTEAMKKVVDPRPPDGSLAPYWRAMIDEARK